MNLDQVRNKLNEFLQLEEGWDSYNGKAIMPWTVEMLLEKLSTIQSEYLNSDTPWVVPCGDGTVAAEWSGERALEIGIEYTKGEPIWLNFVGIDGPKGQREYHSYLCSPGATDDLLQAYGWYEGERQWFSKSCCGEYRDQEIELGE